MGRAGMLLWAVGVGALLWPSLGLAGFIQHERDGRQTYVQEGKIRSVPAQADEMWMIFDLKGDQMTMVDPGGRRYAHGTSAEYCALVNRMMDFASSLLGSMGIEPQAVVAAEVAVQKEGPGGRIAGRATTRYSVLQDGRLFEELWLTEEPDLMREIAGAGNISFMDCGSDKAAVAVAGEYVELRSRGWPLRSVVHFNGESYTGLDVVRIESQRIPAAAFQPPPEYRRVSLEEFFEMEALEEYGAAIPSPVPGFEDGPGMEEMLKGLGLDELKLPGFGR